MEWGLRRLLIRRRVLKKSHVRFFYGKASRDAGEPSREKKVIGLIDDSHSLGARSATCFGVNLAPGWGNNGVDDPNG